MSGDYQFSAKIVSPAKCNEKPWDSWIGEIGHLSPRPDDDAFVAPAPAEGKGSSRRVHDAHPYKGGGERARYRRSGLHRLRYDSMSLHGLFPQMDNLNAAVCHMCGSIVTCSAAYRHLVEAHAGTESLPPPPPPSSKRTRHKKEHPLPAPVDLLSAKSREVSPAHLTAPPLSRIVLPQQEFQYLEEPSPTPVTGEVQVCVESGELPVVSIQDTEELPLGENLTDDIFSIMNSEGIQSADDITNSADWKNIIRDIGNLQDLNFTQTTEPMHTPDLYGPALHTPLSTYTIPETELANMQFAATTPPLLPILDATILPGQALKQAPATPSTPTTKSQSRSKSSKTKFNLREYDPNKHCGVLTADSGKPCTRSLTCKAHALSLRRLVEGRAKTFDTLLAEHRASRDANANAAAAAAAAATAPPPTPKPLLPAPVSLPPLLVNTSLDLSSLNGLTAEQQVNDIYASLLSVEDPVLPDTSSITPLLSQPMDFVMPDEAELLQVPIISIASPERPPARQPRPDEGQHSVVPTDVCWYASCPRPLALCTFNASHAGGAITLGKRYATVRSNIKSSLSRSSKTSSTTNNFYYGQNALTLSKSVHMNASKSNKPEVRKLIVTCSDSGGKVQQTLNELFGGHGLNGHVSKARPPLKHSKGSTALELSFLDPLLADEKC